MYNWNMYNLFGRRSMSRWRARGGVVGALALTLALLGGCGEAPTNPQPAVSSHLQPTGPSRMYYDDPCWDDPYFSCHDDGDFPSYDDWSDDPGDAQYWDAESCPAGCTTYALGASTRGSIVN